MNILLAIPFGVRLAGLFLLGTLVAGFVNLGVCRLAWHKRSISPWSPAPEGSAGRTWADLVPLWGWWRMRRESACHGRGFWIRPLAVEIVTGALFAGLYAWQIDTSARHWAPLNAPPPPANFLTDNMVLVEHARYLGQIILISLMLVASLIDFDEKTIPDAITIPGALLGIALAALYPWSLLPAADWLLAGVRQIEFLTLVSPEFWPAGPAAGLLSEPPVWALGCWSLWCGGLLPRQWNTRHGWGTGLRVFVHRLRKEAMTYQILLMWLTGTIGIVVAARWLPQSNWAALVTALVGVAAGGGIIWLVRVIGTAALRREAMGFGDVTLMAMIGAFLGWQGAIVIFFMAPFAGLIVGLVQWIFHGEHEIPYGPFLCLAALVLLVEWVPIWEWAQDIFALGGLVPLILGGCLVLMGLLLWAYRMLLGAIGRSR